jgi:chorismate mutase
VERGIQEPPEWAERMNIHKDFVAELFKLIHLESIRKQTEVVEKVNVQ